jgi:GDP-D-mannose dehydratase
MEAWLRLQVGGEVSGPAHLRDGVIVAEALANIQPDRFYNLRYCTLSSTHLRDGVIVAEALANIQPERFYNLRYCTSSIVLHTAEGRGHCGRGSRQHTA